MATAHNTIPHTPETRERFLAALARLGRVDLAAEETGIDRSVTYDWRKADPAFAAKWEVARQLGAEKLEDEAYRRGHDGVDKPVFQGGGQVGTVREYSDTLLIFLLKGAMPHKYKDRVQNEHTGKDGGPIDLRTLTTEDLERLISIRRRVTTQPTRN